MSTARDNTSGNYNDGNQLPEEWGGGSLIDNGNGTATLTGNENYPDGIYSPAEPGSDGQYPEGTVHVDMGTELDGYYTVTPLK